MKKIGLILSLEKEDEKLEKVETTEIGRKHFEALFKME